MRAKWTLIVATLAGVGGGCGGGASPPDPMAREKGRAELARVRASFGVLETLAGAGLRQEDVNEWAPEFEGGPATAAELSAPHNALGDADGNVFIADKEAHAIRKVTPDGHIETVAGVNAAGDDGDAPGDARTSHLDWPNGLWVASSGTVYVLDLGNFKVRRLDRTGQLSTLFVAPTVTGGRGLWVADDESLAYVSSSGELLRWTPSGGVDVFATGFVDLGNLIVEPDGTVLITDRGASRVYHVAANGAARPIAGSDAAVGSPEDGLPALETSLDGVRGIWRVPGAGLLLGTHRGSRVFYMDSFGFVHVLIDGTRGAHCCDGEPLTGAGLKVSEVRNVTMTPAGDLLVTEHDAGYVRIARRAP